MEKIQDLHDAAKEVLEEAAISKLAVKSMEDVASRANRIARWARNAAEMDSADAKSVKALAKDIQKTMDKWAKGSWEGKSL